MRSSRLIAFASIGLAAFAATTLAAQNPNYHVVKRTVMGRMRADYLVIDPEGRRLYGIGNTVINVDDDSVVDSVPGGGGGYVIAHDQNRGLVRNGTVFDLTTDAVTGHLDIRGDGVRYEPVTHRGFVWRGHNAWVVDMTNGQLIADTTIGDGDESGAADGRGKLFLNVEDSGFIQRVDARTLRIEETYKIPACGHAQGLSMDTATRRLFMACDTEMIVVNADNGNVVQRIRVPSRADQNCFDPSTKLAFNPNRVDSTMTVVHEDSPSRFTVGGKVPTGGAARTCAVDERTHKVYVFYYEGTTRENFQLVLAVLAP